MPQTPPLIVLDFETTGLSPDYGDRAIEIGAVRIEAGEITGRFQSLMNPGRRISGFIEDYTGITNAMLKDAPPCGEVMEAFIEFAGEADMVAHNASFDRRFLAAEWQMIGRRCGNAFACSMLIARRIYQEAPNHKLGTLVAFNNIANDGTFHRALADAEMTAQLWLLMVEEVKQRSGARQVPFKWMQALAKTPKRAVDRFLATQLSD